MNAYREVTCSTGCAHALREDTRLGLIYGPFAVPNGSGGWNFVSRRAWAAYANVCIYCNSPLPRGRAKRIARALCEASRAAA